MEFYLLVKEKRKEDICRGKTINDQGLALTDRQIDRQTEKGRREEGRVRIRVKKESNLE